MTAPHSESRDRLIRVQGPALPPVKLVSGPTPPVAVCELIRVHGPALPPVTLVSGPVEPATVEAALPALANGERAYRGLSAMIGGLNDFQSLYNRPGVRVDTERSGVRDGRVVVVLAPNDPADAVETCRRVADYLFAALRTIPGATVRVMVAGQPDQVSA